jgi:hypothetical protein
MRHDGAKPPRYAGHELVRKSINRFLLSAYRFLAFPTGGIRQGGTNYVPPIFFAVEPGKTLTQPTQNNRYS